MPQTSSKKTAYRWTTPAEEAFLSVLAEAVKMGLRPKTGFKAVVFQQAIDAFNLVGLPKVSKPQLTLKKDSVCI
jgi:hypothetical protein